MARTQITYQLLHDERGVVIARRVAKAGSIWERLRGLIGRRGLEADEGLWLVPCNGVHTFGMRFPIDVIVIDKEDQILRVCEAVRPNRVVFPVRNGHGVVELAAGAIHRRGLRVGDRLRFEETGIEE